MGLNEVEWLNKRLCGIGASESPVLFDLSPYQSRYGLYASKLQLPQAEKTEKEHTKWGNRLEGAICDAVSDDTGLTVVRNGTRLLQSPEKPFMIATIDSWVLNPDRAPIPLEIKNVDRSHEGEWQNDTFPLRVACQVQHQMYVSDTDTAMVAALIGGNKLRIYDVTRDEKFIAELLNRCSDFWDMVQSRTPPPIDGHQCTTEALNAISPIEEQVELSADFGELHARRIRLQQDRKHIDDELSEIDNNIRAAIGTARYGVIPGVAKYSYKEVARNAFSVRASVSRVLREVKL